MRGTLNKKISLGFIFAIIVSILIVSIISNRMIDKQFNQYLSGEHKSRVNKIISLVEDLYSEQGQEKSLKNEEITRYAVLENYYIEVRDNQNNLVFTSGKDHLLPNNTMNSMMNSMMGGMMQGYPNMRIGQYIEEKYPLKINNKAAGTLIIGYFGNWNISQEAMSFKMTFNQSLILSGIAALVIGLIISLSISRGLTVPIVKISRTAEEMTKGNLGMRSDVKTNTLEIDELSKSINYLAETLQHQEMLRKRLSSDMAHEIRTPLTTVKTYIEAILDGIWEPSNERLSSCYEELERITKLTDNLQNLAKAEQANLVVNKARLDVSDEMKKIVNTFEPVYEKNNTAIFADIEDNVMGSLDKDKFKQIMYNLLSNASKNSKEEGKVWVRLMKEGNWIKIEIEDNGIGIDEKDLPYIFERFYRGDISRSRETGGTGIGLTITRALVEAHGGKIEAESAKGKGSIFRLRLPV
jgi:signal transduction histidine kinase